MTWLTWRQLRSSAVALYAAVAAFAAVLALTGPRLAHLARVDPDLFDSLTRTDRNLYNTGIVVVALAPAVVGAFWGAPMVARELEAGTHRLVWNQSVTRTRWLATKLGLTTLAGAAVLGVLSLAVTWWSDPLDGVQSRTRGNLPSRVTPVAFAMRGVAPVGYAVFALVLGVAAGLVLRRTLPAMAVTLALFTFVQIAVPLWIRPHLLPPVSRTVTLSRTSLDSITVDASGKPVHISLATGGRDWVLTNRTVDAAGRPARLPTWFGGCLPPPVASAGSRGVAKVDELNRCLGRLDREGYRQHLVYQPASRFWPLQVAETGLYLAVSALLAGFCFWWTRRRLG